MMHKRETQTSGSTDDGAPDNGVQVRAYIKRAASVYEGDGAPCMEIEALLDELRAREAPAPGAGQADFT